MSELRDLKIEGMGSCYGGTYDNVKLEGIASIKDDLKCNVFSSEGMCKCEGTIEANEITAEGTFKSTKDIKAKRLKAEGLFTVKQGTVGADSIEMEGCISCNELSADYISIEGVCKVDKLFGDLVKINPGANFRGGFNFFFKQSDVSKARLIECTELVADVLDAEVVRASRVKLGKHCVDLVEYSESADIHPNAKIKELVKI